MKFIENNKNIILLTIGSFLVLLSFCLISYDRFELLKRNVFNEIELEKYRENTKNDPVVEPEQNLVLDDVDTEVINDNDNNNTQNNQVVEPTYEPNPMQKEFIGYLVIDKVNLNQGLVSKNSYYNDIAYNIQILKESDYPDKQNGNVILASHSGTGSISYFKNLYKLNVGDEARIHYKGYIYTYRIVNIYNVIKNGTVEIRRNTNKSCLTLITCTYNSESEQTVYILELSSKVLEGGGA